jgi:hypothetical protein
VLRLSIIDELSCLSSIIICRFVLQVVFIMIMWAWTFLTNQQQDQKRKLLVVVASPRAAALQFDAPAQFDANFFLTFDICNMPNIPITLQPHRIQRR